LLVDVDDFACWLDRAFVPSGKCKSSDLLGHGLLDKRLFCVGSGRELEPDGIAAEEADYGRTAAVYSDPYLCWSFAFIVQLLGELDIAPRPFVKVSHIVAPGKVPSIP
jgi:hypothetical protein